MVLKRAEEPLRMSGESRIINPGIEIPEGATAVHGITTERARAEGIPLEEAVDHLVKKLLWAAEEEIPLVGFNVSFDITLLDQLARQVLGKGLVALDWHGPVLDVFVIDKHFDRYRKGGRKLTDLAKTYGVPLRGDAHDAVTDVRATIEILLAMTRRKGQSFKGGPNWEDLSVWTPGNLRQLQATWRRNQMSDFAEYRARKGEEPIPLHQYAWPIYDYSVEDFS
jgi:DNA polymerase-3 subunit epsilon